MIDIRTQIKVITVLTAIVGEVNGEPVFALKPVKISLWLAMSPGMPINKEAIEAN